MQIDNTLAQLRQHGLVERAAEHIKKWLTEPIYAEFRQEIEEMIQKGDVDALNDAFYQVIPFGTGGRRGKMGVGPNRINNYTIASSAEGYIQYLIKTFGKDVVKERGFVITYDVRHNSDLFARKAAAVIAAHGVPVYFFDGPRSTPQVSFSVRYTGAIGGAMISASHNPPDYNGIKIYWNHGGQAVPPFDKEIIEAVQAVTAIDEGNYDALVANGTIRIQDEAADHAYQDAVGALSLSDERDVRIVFTPMHGVSTTSFLPVLQRVGFEDIIPYEPHMSLDGDFPHVPNHIPNPEVPQSLAAAVEFAKEKSADLVLASDPDADRIGVVSRAHSASDDFTFLNGNQIAVLLLDYITKKRSVEGTVLVKTVVTTDLLTSIAKANKMDVIGDLPVGFKYIGDAMDHRMQGRTFLFGAEESHGYLYGDYARDKDGAIGALLISEYAALLKKEGKTLAEQLEEIKKQYGYYRELLQSIFFEGMDGMDRMQAIMAAIRTAPFTTLAGHHVVKMLDQQEKKYYGGGDHVVLGEYEGFADNALAFYLNEEESIRVVIRPSGTEPKIKFYAAVGLAVGAGISEEQYLQIQEKANALAHQLLSDLISFAETISPGGKVDQVLG